MPLQLIEEEERFLEVRVSGTLRPRDYALLVEDLQRLSRRSRKRLEVLFDFNAYLEWGAGIYWDEVPGAEVVLDRVERLALVGDEQQQPWMIAFSRPFTRAEIRFFPARQLEEARDWIGHPSTEKRGY